MKKKKKVECNLESVFTWDPKLNITKKKLVLP